MNASVEVEALCTVELTDNEGSKAEKELMLAGAGAGVGVGHHHHGPWRGSDDAPNKQALHPVDDYVQG
jgi:hypothetical protein